MSFAIYGSGPTGMSAGPDTDAITSAANKALSNLASVSVNASLIPQSGKDLGAQLTPWRDAYLYGSGTFGTHSMRLTGAPTGHRVITFPDATGTLATASGTPGKLAKFTAASVLGDSIITESGASVSVAGTLLAVAQSDVMSATFRRFGAAQTANVLEIQTEANAFLAGFTGAGALIAPSHIGGTAVGSALTLQSTSGVGTTDYIEFAVGNAGATKAMRISNAGYVYRGYVSASDYNVRLGGAADEISIRGGNLAIIHSGTQSYFRNNAGSSGIAIESAGGGPIRLNPIAGQAVGIGPSNTSPTGTLSVYDAGGAGVTRLWIREGAGQAASEVWGIYANDGTTQRLSYTAGRLTFGGVSSSDPALIKNGIILQSILADGSNLAPFRASQFMMVNNSTIKDPSGDGIVVIYNNAQTDFNRLQLGGTTSSFPALKRSTTGLIARLADDSSDTWMQASQFRSTLTTPASATATGVAGTIVWDAGFVYVCTATDTWKRVAIASW